MMNHNNNNIRREVQFLSNQLIGQGFTSLIKKNVGKYIGLPQQLLKTLPVDTLKSMQPSCYNKMNELENPMNAFFGDNHSDEILAMKSRKRGSDNSFQVDRLLKMTKNTSGHTLNTIENQIRRLKNITFALVEGELVYILSNRQKKEVPSIFCKSTTDKKSFYNKSQGM